MARPTCTRPSAALLTVTEILKETPLVFATNLSARLGNEIWLKREDLQEVFSFKIRGAYNFMASLGEEERWKGVITCSAGTSFPPDLLCLFITSAQATMLRVLRCPAHAWGSPVPS
jgi:hypothetical protein